MARAWRDLLSFEEFQAMQADKAYRSKNSPKTTGLDQGLDRTRLKEIATELQAYHNIPKRDLKSLSNRRLSLQKISQLAESYLQLSGVTPAKAAERQKRTYKIMGVDQPPGTPGAIERRNQATVKDESLERNLLTIQRRALRKMNYLHALEHYCHNNSPDSFGRFVHEEIEQDRAGGLGISKHNLAEKEDFAHRDGWHSGALFGAFQEWCNDSTSPNIHFFLWLEDHPICTSQDRTKGTYAEVTPVTYGGQAGSNKFEILSLNAGQLQNSSGNAVDTYAANFATEFSKKIANDNPWAKGIAAYVWSANNELFIAEHLAGRFHHSSLLAGAKVKCAGMIGIRNGKIEELSNNSGHYKPGVTHMMEFAMFYRAAFAPVHVVVVTTGPGEGFYGLVDTLLTKPRGGITLSASRPNA